MEDYRLKDENFLASSPHRQKDGERAVQDRAKQEARHGKANLYMI
jgi:hypothetical protein